MSFVNTVDLIGDEALAASIIGKSVTEIADSHSKSVGGYALYGCNSLTKVVFPLVTSIGEYGFASCTSLSVADFSLVTSIGERGFDWCALTALILRSKTVCALKNADALNSTPIKSGAGYIYVPAALIDSYKSATNWSTYAAQFRALEDYTVDGTTTGELDPDKI